MPPPLIPPPTPRVNLGMRSKLAVGVYVHAFQNLDLLTQGWYALRCYVRRARDQESGLMDGVIEVPVPMASATERTPADPSLDWHAIRAPPLTIKDRRRREARQRYKMNRHSKAKGCLERVLEDGDTSDSSDDEDEPGYTTRAFKIQWACEKFCVEHFTQFVLPINLNARDENNEDDEKNNGYSSDSSADSEFDEDAAADDVYVVFELLHVKASPDENDKDKDAIPDRAKLMKSVVASQRVRIANASAGVHEYFPVHFDERHLTLCDVTVHAHLLEHDPVQSEDSVTFDTHRRYDARAIRTFAKAFQKGVEADAVEVDTLEEALADAHYTYVAPLVASAHAARRCRRLAVVNDTGLNGLGGRGGGGGVGRASSPRRSMQTQGPFGADAEESNRIETDDANDFLSHPNDTYDHALEAREPKTPSKIKTRGNPKMNAGAEVNATGVYHDPRAVSETWRRFMDAHVAGVGVGTMDDSRDWASTALTRLREEEDENTRRMDAVVTADGRDANGDIVFPVRRDNSFVDLLAVARDDEASRCAVLLALALEAAETEARVAWNKLRTELRWRFSSAENLAAMDVQAADDPVNRRLNLRRGSSGAADLDDIIIESPGDFAGRTPGSVVRRSSVSHTWDQPGIGHGRGGAWLLEPLRDRWEHRRVTEWAPWVVREASSGAAGEIAILAGDAPAEDNPEGGVSDKTVSDTALYDGAVVGLRGAKDEVARRRAAMAESPNYVLTTTPTQRAFDYTALTPPSTVPQVSIQEVVGLDGGHVSRGDSSPSASSPPGSPTKGVESVAAEADSNFKGQIEPGSPVKSIKSVASDASSLPIGVTDTLGADLPGGEHMVFLVHGFAGSLQDLRLLRAHLQVACPNVHTRVSAANHERTGVDSIEAMGARLAEEVAEVMEDLESGALVPRGGGREPRSPAVAGAELAARFGSPPRVSFAAHSVGVLIVRAALTHPAMAPYLPSLHLFLSISGPHLGYVGGEMTVADSSKSRNRFGLGKSAAFQLGLCCTRAINPKAKCLSEITFRDCAKIEDCYLYRLAHHPNGLGLFRHVVLVSSPQDKYVPRHSARVQLEGFRIKEGSRRARATMEMARAMLTPVLEKALRRERGGEIGTGGGPGGGGGGGEEGDEEAKSTSHVTTLTRADVHFAPYGGVDFNQLIGRKAHIDFLETDEYVRFLIWRLRHAFM